jgi:hypothetical protein
MHTTVTSNKVRVRPIRVNVLLTLDRVNLDLLYPRWLPHRCHVGWSGLLRVYTAGCRDVIKDDSGGKLPSGRLRASTLPSGRVFTVRRRGKNRVRMDMGVRADAKKIKK